MAVTGPWAPPPSSSLCNSLVRWVRWISRFRGREDPIHPGEERTEESSCGGDLGQGSYLHKSDLEAFHHALHVEDEGVLVGIVLNDVVVHVYQDAVTVGVRNKASEPFRLTAP